MRKKILKKTKKREKKYRKSRSNSKKIKMDRKINANVQVITINVSKLTFN